MAKTTTPPDRIELDYVSFTSETWPHRQAYAGVLMLVSDNETKIYLGEEAGIPCVLIENPTYRQPGRVPLSNVASFSVKK